MNDEGALTATAGGDNGASPCRGNMFHQARTLPTSKTTVFGPVVQIGRSGHLAARIHAYGQSNQPREVRSSLQACSQRRHASAQIRQCSCISAWCWHSSPHALHTVAQDWSTAWVMLES